MPVTKKSTTKKAATTKDAVKVKEEVVKPTENVEEIKQETLVEKKPTRKRLTKNKRQEMFDLDLKAQVPVRKIGCGTIGYQCKTVNRYLLWSEPDSEYMMTIEEVLNMNNESSLFLHEPLLMVDDEEVMEALNLTDLYNTLFEIEDLDSFCNNSISTIKNKLDTMPKTLRQQVITKMMTAINVGSLKCKNLLGIMKMLKNDYDIDIEI